MSIIHENTKSQELVSCNNGENFTTSEIIAEGVGYEHKTVLQLARKYQSKLERFGTLAFEMRKSGGRPKEIALFNKGQASFLMTLMRNNDVVVDFKLRLVEAFEKLVEAKPQSPQLPQSMAQALRLAADQAEEIEKLEAQNQKMLPVVERHKALTKATGLMKFSEAAKVICNTGVDTGQNRFIKWLKENGYLFKNHNEPKQIYIEQGLFKTKAVNYKHPHTEEVIVTMQTYITPKGVDRFAKEMKQLETA